MAEQKRYDYNRIDSLVREVASGGQERDTLPDLSYRFEKEAQAMYFSNMRRNMRSRTASSIMHCNPDLRELRTKEILG